MIVVLVSLQISLQGETKHTKTPGGQNHRSEAPLITNQTLQTASFCSLLTERLRFRSVLIIDTLLVWTAAHSVVSKEWDLGNRTTDLPLTQSPAVSSQGAVVVVTAHSYPAISSLTPRFTQTTVKC